MLEFEEISMFSIKQAVWLSKQFFFHEEIWFSETDLISINSKSLKTCANWEELCMQPLSWVGKNEILAWIYWKNCSCVVFNHFILWWVVINLSLRSALPKFIRAPSTKSPRLEKTSKVIETYHHLTTNISHWTLSLPVLFKGDPIRLQDSEAFVFDSYSIRGGLEKQGGL